MVEPHHAVALDSARAGAAHSETSLPSDPPSSSTGASAGPSTT
ncbi:hypothetical protein ACFQX7_15230 [Luedemannella flava]